ncbi:unnamed protein product [Lupinus luteus]|uniref:Uncharacterized protein n=1 Tax=Lupinus luteus TaxID=3873 RepID=A0AAV1YCN0_LUPLU
MEEHAWMQENEARVLKEKGRVRIEWNMCEDLRRFFSLCPTLVRTRGWDPRKVYEEGDEVEIEKLKVELSEQLKWKEEHFIHQEEAHEKLRDHFVSGKDEWELENSTLLDEICSLQIKLESQVRISQHLQHQLQTLAHEESQRKCLEVDVSDSKVLYDNVSNECQDARSELEGLRYSLKTKEKYYEESKYLIEKLELENHETKTAVLKELEKELESSHSSTSEMMLLNEELSVMLFQQGVSETQLNISN